MAKKEVDIDEELEKISRKTNFKVRKTEYSFDQRLKKLDKEIDDALDEKIKMFDENKQLTSKYLTSDYSADSLNKYREKLKRI